MALLDKVSDGKGVLEDIARSESLVCLAVSIVLALNVQDTYHVEEGEVLLLLADVGKLLPLLFRWVNTGGVLAVSRVRSPLSVYLRGHKHVAR